MKLWGRLLVVMLAAVLSTSVLPSALPAFATDSSSASISLYANRSVYLAGDTAKITVVVYGAGSGKYLRVTLTRANGTSTVVNSYAYNDTFRRDFTMYVDSTVKAELIDTDKTTVLDTKSKTLPVRAVVGSDIVGYYQQSGSYAVFAKGSSPSFRSATLPPRKYRCLKHEIWRAYSSGWKVVSLSACKVENSQGVVTWQWAGTHPSGVHFRVRARFFGDSLNHANSGTFIYFRFK